MFRASWVNGVSGLRAVAVLMLLLGAAQPASAEGLAGAVDFDIQAQKLSTALLKFSEQAGVQILTATEFVTDVDAPAIRGRMVPTDAMVKLLEGTRLKFHVVGTNAIAIDAGENDRRADEGSSSASQKGKWFRVAQNAGASEDQQSSEGDVPNSPASSSKEAGSKLEEIVVTAERREEGAQRVPISMTVFSGDFIKQYLSDPFDLAKLTPNYQISSTNNMTISFATLRGLGSSDQANPIAASSILTYYDGIVSGTPFASTIPQWDLDRIEVLRGPQGTLFGRNAVGGAIQYISAAPTDEFEGYGQFTAGEFDLRRYEGAVSGPITDKVKARISALTYDRGGDVTNTFLNTKVGERTWWGVRGIVDWEVSDNFDVRVKAQHFEGDEDPLAFNAAPGNLLSASTREWLDVVGADPDLQRESNFERVQSSLQSPFTTFDIDLAQLDLNYDFGAMKLTVVGGYLDGERLANADLANYPSLSDDLVPDASTQWSGEVRLTSQTDHPLQWIAGAYYQRAEDSARLTADVTGSLRDLDGDGLTRVNADSPEDLLDGRLPIFPGVSTVALAGGNAQETETDAVFLHTTYEWTDRLTTTHAVRYTREEKQMDYRFFSFFEFPVSFGVTPGTPAQHNDFIAFANLTPAQQRQQALSIISDPNTVDANGNVVPTSLSDSWKEVTWRFAADYRLTDDALVYSSISKGFKGGIFSIFTDATTVASADPETSIVYEVGAKTQSFNNRLQVNASVFYNDHRDFQTTLVTISPNGTFLNLVDNTPKSRIYGGELEIRAVPFANLLVAANFGFLQSEITKVTPGNEALLGNELPYAEDKSFSGLVRYGVPTTLGTFSPQLSWRYRGKYWSTKINNDVLTGKLGGFWTADAGLGYESADGKLYGLFYCNNLFDEVRPVRNALPANAAGGTTISFINTRRNWGVTVGYRF